MVAILPAMGTIAIKIREARFDDFAAVGPLKQRHGLVTVWRESRWSFLWRENPVHQTLTNWPIGWILEAEGRVVGYLGNVPVRYWYQGQPVLVAIARGFAVDPDVRGHSLKLVAAFFSQKQPDLLLATTANDVTAAVFKMAKAAPVPYPDYDVALLWVVFAGALVAAALKRAGIPGVLARVGGLLAGPAVWLGLKLRGHGPRRGTWAGELAVIQPGDIGPEFDELWQRRQIELAQAVLPERSATALRWHFGHEGARLRHAQVLVARQNAALAGYLVLTREDSPAIGLKRYRVADLFVAGDSRDVIDALLGLAYETARRDGVHVVEWVGFPKRIRERFTSTAPLVRKMASWPFWYRALHAEKLPKLDESEAWYASSYDGDTSL